MDSEVEGMVQTIQWQGRQQKGVWKQFMGIKINNSRDIPKKSDNLSSVNRIDPTDQQKYTAYIIPETELQVKRMMRRMVVCVKEQVSASGSLQHQCHC